MLSPTFEAIFQVKLMGSLRIYSITKDIVPLNPLPPSLNPILRAQFDNPYFLIHAKIRYEFHHYIQIHLFFIYVRI